MKVRVVALTALVALAGLLAGCRASPPPAPGPLPGPEALPQQVGPDTALVRISTAGWAFGKQPVNSAPWSVYRDGRIIGSDGGSMQTPAPAVEVYRMHIMNPQQLSQFHQQALAAVSGASQGLGHPDVFDLPTTTITVLSNSGPVSVEGYGLLASLGEGHLTQAQRQSRAALREVMRQAGYLDNPGASKPETTPYVPTHYAALVTPYQLQPTPNASLPSLAVNEQNWPGSTLPGAALPTLPVVSGCVVVAVPQLAPVLESTDHPVNADTAWVSGGQRWKVALRPLLPDEQTCVDAVRHLPAGITRQDMTNGKG